jgi:integrase
VGSALWRANSLRFADEFAGHHLRLWTVFDLASMALATAPVPTGKKNFLFRSCIGRSSALSQRPMAQPDVYQMIASRAQEAGLQTAVGCHSFRATGITEYLKAGGRLDVAQTIANHESPRTTALYDRREEKLTQSEGERLVL